MIDHVLRCFLAGLFFWIASACTMEMITKVIALKDTASSQTSGMVIAVACYSLAIFMMTYGGFDEK